MQLIFNTVSLGFDEWVQIIGVSSLGFVIMELSKFPLWLASKNKSESEQA